MTEIEKMKRIYDGISRGEELTTQGLYQMGLTPKDLFELVKSDSSELVRVKRGQYSLASLDNLFMYGEDFRLQKRYEEAQKVYAKCYEIDPSFSKPYFQLFFQSIKNKDDQKILEFFERMFYAESECGISKNDLNCYLLLLNEIMELPCEYQNVIQNLKPEDVLFQSDGTLYNYIVEFQNKARSSMFEGKYDVTLGMYLTDRSSFSKIVVLLCSRLEIAKSIELRKQEINELIYFYSQKREYAKVVSVLESPDNEFALGLVNSNILKLAKAYLEIKSTGVVPKKEQRDTKSFFEAIYVNDYELALNLAYEYEETKNKPNFFLMQLLTDIVAEIKKVNENSEQNVKVLDDSSDSDQKLNLSESIDGVSLSFLSILKHLKNGEIDISIRLLYDYLRENGKEQYAFLLSDCIKIGIITKDNFFQKLISAFIQINREKFLFDVIPYVEDFFKTLEKRSLEEAGVYLHIITSSRLDSNFEIDAILENCFYEAKQNLPVIGRESSDVSLENISSVTEDGSLQKKSNVKSETAETSGNNSFEKQELTKSSRERVKNFVDKKVKVLEEDRGILILDKLSEERVNSIQEYLETLSNITFFTIGTNDNKKIILRYIDETLDGEWIDYRAIRDSINEAYKSRNYNLSIELSLKLLSHRIFNPKKTDYSILAFSYLKKWNKEKAIIYFSVITELNNTQGEYRIQSDFSELIARLKGEIPQEETKGIVKVALEEFEKNDEENDKIRRLHSISRLVVEENLDIDEACSQYGMSIEEILIVKLEFARFSYIKGDIEIGNQILKMVEQSETKSKTVLKLLDEIRRMKRLYVNRTSENELINSLSIPSLNKF